MLGRLVAVVWIGAGLTAAAQDTRTVTEPVIPPACERLEAKLASVNDKVREDDEGKLDTERIQRAIDGCGAGKAVELVKGGGNDAFLAGPLEMREGVTLVVDKGVTLFGSRDPKVYEMKGEGVTPGLCGTTAEARPPDASAANTPAPRGGCRPLISIVNAKNVGIMGEGVIDGRGYATLMGKDYSWWQMARRAQPEDRRYFSTRLIIASHADGLVLYKITLHNSPNFHVSVNQTNGFTAWGVHLKTPTDRSLDARNTDGIDPGSSTNVTVTHSWIDNGDDNIAIKTGVTHMSVIDNHFYSGHGMSIGSETYSGVSDLLVDGLVEDHTTSGIRVKSNVTRGGLVHDLVYKNVCMKDVKVPISISPYYANQTTEPYKDPQFKGSRIPDYKRITIANMTSVTPGDVLIAGLDDAHRTEITLDNVHLNGMTKDKVHGHFATVTLGPGGTDLDFSGTDIKVVPNGGKTAAPYDCTGKFVPYQ